MILTEPEEFPYLGMSVKRTHRICLPKTYLQGPIPRLHLESRKRACVIERSIRQIKYSKTEKLTFKQVIVTKLET